VTHLATWSTLIDEYFWLDPSARQNANVNGSVSDAIAAWVPVNRPIASMPWVAMTSCSRAAISSIACWVATGSSSPVALRRWADR